MDTGRKEPTTLRPKARLKSTASGLSDPRKWVELYGDYLYRFALMRLRDQQLAEDAVQDTLLAAMNARTTFLGHSTERTWLTGILKRKIIDHFRRTVREMEGMPEDYVANGAIEDSRPGKWLIDPNDPAERQEFWSFLNRCLDSLPQKLAVLFVLREVEQLPAEEICNVLGIQPTNLRVSLHRARKQLRHCLEKHWMEVDKVSP